MNLKNSFLKGTLLFGSMFLLAACGSTDKADQVESTEESAVESVKDDASAVVESVESEVEASVESAEEAASESVESAEEDVKQEEAASEASEEAEEAEKEAEKELSEASEALEEASEESESADTLAAVVADDESEESVSEESASEESASEESASEESKEATAIATKETVLVDGVYVLESAEDQDGWNAKASIKIEDGKIVESEFDYEDAEGNKLSESKEKSEAIEKFAGVDPAETFKSLTDQLVDTQDPAEVKEIDGAEEASKIFKEYATLLIESAKAGATNVIVIDENGNQVLDEVTASTSQESEESSSEESAE
ncbi:hypothetical protein [Hutsoniella sourekii]|uniref:hypothetical protein n=1 Tax=Hutsoniella sourekii TaxID=87650 RepID=UPI0004889624|nr:hypothetical protein [Hutsoniella sourekii]